VKGKDDSESIINEFRQCAQNTLAQIREVEPNADFDQATLERLEAYFLRKSEPLTADKFESAVLTLGSFLGETIIRASGGNWIRHQRLGWSIFANEGTFFVFAKADKFLSYGQEESVVSLYRAVQALCSRD
jgi:G3E family GTPase